MIGIECYKMHRNGLKGTPAETASIPSPICLDDDYVPQACEADQLLIQCYSVIVTVVKWEQMYPIGMSSMRAEEVER